MKKLMFDYWKRLLWIVVSGIACLSCKEKNNSNQPVNQERNNSHTEIEEIFNLPYQQIGLRDPFVLVDAKSQSYYIHVNGGGKTNVYKSKDLKMWKKLVKPSFTPDATFWGTKDFWAPDVYHYNNKYYMFITVSSDSQKRGTTILISDKPEGPFTPLTNKPVTPEGWMCLDGSLYIDKSNQPWIIFCREWLEVIDGEIYAQKLSEDLKTAVENPVLLFKATEAAWVGSITVRDITGYVTDAPVIQPLDNGALAMIWSSFDKSGKYVIGQAISPAGNLFGPWQQMEEPLNKDDGGHAMLFKDFDGKLKISYHSPNNPNSRLTIYDVVIDNQKLKIVFP